MADLVFRNTPWTIDPAHSGEVIVKDSWPKWQRDVWLKMLASAGFSVPKTLWRPIYQPLDKLTVTEPGNDGTVQTQQLNQQFFLSKESAFYLAGQFGATVSEQPPDVAGGMESVPAGVVEFWLNWIDDTNKANPVAYKVNSGGFAYYFCPAGGEPSPATLENPDLAVRECQAAKDSAHIDALRARG